MLRQHTSHGSLEECDHAPDTSPSQRYTQLGVLLVLSVNTNVPICYEDWALTFIDVVPIVLRRLQTEKSIFAAQVVKHYFPNLSCCFGQTMEVSLQALVSGT